MIVALAYDLEQARAVLKKKMEMKENHMAWAVGELMGDPIVVTRPDGFWVHGGG